MPNLSVFKTFPTHLLSGIHKGVSLVLKDIMKLITEEVISLIAELPGHISLRDKDDRMVNS